MKRNYFREFMVSVLENAYFMSSDNNWIDYDDNNLRKLVDEKQEKRIRMNNRMRLERNNAELFRSLFN